MSAIRQSRSSHRLSSPYARPKTKNQKSSWSLGSLLKFLNPLKAFSPEPVDEDLSEESFIAFSEDSVSPATPPPPPSLPPPPRLASPLPTTDSPSKTQNLKTVASYLHENRASSLSGEQLEKLASIIEQNLPTNQEEEKRVPFRFSTTPLASPQRGNSPFSGTTTFRSSTPTADSPRKTLKVNPNGPYRWQGAGSSRPLKSRNHYHSPAFGRPSPASERIVLREKDGLEKKDLITPRSEKRRRVGSADSSPVNGLATPSPPPPRSAAPALSPTRAAEVSTQSFPIPPGSSSPTKSNGIRSAGSSTPANPSPLRQAWGDGSPSESVPRQTKAANFMTELIKEVTPPKKPDISNPYQAASPVKNVAKKRTRAIGRPAPPRQPAETTPKPVAEVAKEKEYSAQAIIEATLPKGSKRSRPPTQAEKPTPRSISPPSTLRRSPRRETVQLEEVDDDDDPQSKRSKLNGVTEIEKSQVSTEIIDSESDKPSSDAPQAVKPITSAAPPGRPFNAGSLKASTAPKEPSKLRYVYQPESSSPPAASAGGAPSMPAFTFSTPSSPLKNTDEVSLGSFKPVSSVSPRETVLAMPSTSLPTFEFSFPSAAFPKSNDVKSIQAAKALAISSLPTFDLSKSPEPVVAQEPVVETKAKVVGFDWSATTLKKPTNEGGQWTCSCCMISNAASATKCIACETDR